MCGIFGLLRADGIKGEELMAMSHVLRHRGPDDEGFLFASGRDLVQFGGVDTPENVMQHQASFTPRQRLPRSWASSVGGVALGHRRLAIVDLSPQGHQPMSYRERYWIIFNGEVYNYVELRDELSKLGHQFASMSDTEVILAAYAEWGPDCLSRFNGMWGLAIFDRERETLFIARDRFGVKPVYYRETADCLAFSSEIKAFGVLQDWRATSNRERLLDYLVWNVTDHTSETMFEGVRQLPAGHYLMVDVKGLLRGETHWSPALGLQRWYDLPDASCSLVNGDVVDQFRALLESAVRLRLRADVPVGSCLSGGLDSSGIVCLMRSELARAGVAGTLKTFTSQSADREFDEARFARAVIAATNAEGFFVNPEPNDLFAELDDLLWHQDEPVLSSSIIAQRHVFRAARKAGVIVMLDGQGADEILCGYRGFFGAYLAGLVRTGDLSGWRREVGALRREGVFAPLRSLGYTGAYLWPGLRSLLGKFDRRAVDRGWIQAAHQSIFHRDPIRSRGGRASSVREMSVAQLRATNLPMLLHWEDRNSMAFSVEARVPFLDYRLVEFCLQLRDEEKLGGGISKRVLRQSMRGLVPDVVLDRRDKMGFLTAEPLWMKREPRFRAELVKAIDAMGEMVSPSIIQRFDEMVAGRQPYDPRYWRVICAARWMHCFGVSSS